MTDLFFMLFTGIAIGFSGAMIPGPLTLFTVSGALRTNKFAGFKTIFGHIIIEFLLIAAIFLGFHRLFIYEGFLLATSFIGGLAFIVMGLILFLNSGKMRLSDMKTDLEFSKGLIIGGMFFSIASPGFIVWWATIGFSTLIKASLVGLMGVIFLVLGHWLADVLWYGFLSFAVDKGRVFLNDRKYRNIMRFFSVLLVILGFHYLFYLIRVTA